LHIYDEDGVYTVTDGSETKATNTSLTAIIDAVRYYAVLMMVGSRSDLLWIHAGAAAHGNGAVVFLGSFGSGKSTLVMNLYRLGWKYLSDDLIPFDPRSGIVYPFPLLPRIREGPGKEIPRECLHKLSRVEVNLSPGMVGKKAVGLRTLVFPNFSLSAPLERKELCKATAVLEILRNALNSKDHNGDTIRHLCNLVKHTQTFQLTFRDGEQAARLFSQ